jgi:hypothetical protein
MHPFLGLVWLHTADISIAINTSSGAVQHFNTSLGFTRGPTFSAGIYTGEDRSPIVHSVAVAACLHNGAPAVCVESNLTVRGEFSNASCCAAYAVTVRQALWGVALPGVAGQDVTLSPERCALAPLTASSQLR